MRSPEAARSRPAWLLLVLLAVAGVVAVPAARPAPAPSHLEGQRLVVCDAGDGESSVGCSRAAPESSLQESPAAWPAPVETRFGLVDPGPCLPRALAEPFALHQRPPPSLPHS